VEMKRPTYDRRVIMAENLRRSHPKNYTNKSGTSSKKNKIIKTVPIIFETKNSSSLRMHPKKVN
jgi:hypothetical protein